MALMGAFLDKNLSMFSLKSKTTAIEIISAMEKKYVPRNLPMIYLSRRDMGLCAASHSSTLFGACLLSFAVLCLVFMS
jgi:hypothetical protein